MTPAERVPVANFELRLDALAEASSYILGASDARIFLVNGPMGSGKTTLIKAMCAHLGSTDEFSSPTFSIVNEYAARQGKIFHFDLYRLTRVEELYDIGFEEYLDSGAYCFIEWPKLAEPLIESGFVTIEIEMRDEQRVVSVFRS